MNMKHGHRWCVTIVMLALLTSIWLSGCRSATPTTISTVTTPETSEPLQTPELPNGKKETPRSSENPQVPDLNQETEPIPEPETAPEPETESLPEQNAEHTPSVYADESDNSPAPTPPIDRPQTPIHPYYDLSGTPPSAPGLAMRVRAFSAEPQKIVYLTFDDGPYPQTTPRILKILQDEGVKATFFVVGKQVERYPDLLKAEYEQGEGIGNHSYSHDNQLVYRSPEAFLAEIKKNEELIFKVIGIRPKVVRAPGGTQGHFHVSYYNAVDAADYLVYDWNVSSGDAEASLVPADTLLQNIQIQVPGKDRIVLLMHDAGAKVTTVDALPQIIKYLKQKGYSFGVITPKVAPILFPGGFRS